MRKLFYCALLAVLIMPVLSCEKKKSHSLRDDARALYEQSISIVRKYTDSISAAKDSASLLSLFSRYDDAVTRLNYSCPAGAAYEITEGENDTLTNLSLRLISLKDSLLASYAQRLEELPDSAMTLISQEAQSN